MCFFRVRDLHDTPAKQLKRTSNILHKTEIYLRTYHIWGTYFLYAFAYDWGSVDARVTGIRICRIRVGFYYFSFCSHSYLQVMVHHYQLWPDNHLAAIALSSYLKWSDFINLIISYIRKSKVTSELDRPLQVLQVKFLQVIEEHPIYFLQANKCMQYQLNSDFGLFLFDIEMAHSHRLHVYLTCNL